MRALPPERRGVFVRRPGPAILVDRRAFTGRDGSRGDRRVAGVDTAHPGKARSRPLATTEALVAR